MIGQLVKVALIKKNFSYRIGSLIEKFKISYCLADIRAVLAGQSSDTKQEDNLNLTEVACPVVVRVDHPGANLDHLMVHYV